MGPPPTTPIKPQPDQDLSGLVGKHIIYTYANGWHYEYYFRNENAGDYRIASGMVADRWMINQRLLINNLGRYRQEGLIGALSTFYSGLFTYSANHSLEQAGE